MLKFKITNKRLTSLILLSFLSLTLLVSGCLSLFEWNNFEYNWVRISDYVTMTVTGDLHLRGAADSTGWTGHRHAIEAFQYPDTWTGDTLKTTYQVYKIKLPTDSLMKSSIMTWHSSKAVAEMAEGKAPAEKGNLYRGFESDSTITWSQISALIGSEYRIHYVTTLTVFDADSLRPTLIGQILGDQMDGLWSGRSLMVDRTQPYIPTLTQWGLIILVTLLIISGIVIIRRRRKTVMSM